MPRPDPAGQDFDFVMDDLSRRHPDRFGHRGDPGPAYWEWRCRSCDEPIAAHPTLWQRLVGRAFGGAGA